MKISELFDLRRSAASRYLEMYKYPWQALDGIGRLIPELASAGGLLQIADGVWAAKSAHIAATAFISAPCIIGEYSEIRHCAYIRGNAVIGNECVVGNSTEVKNSILFDCVQIPHYNYVGDSVLGYKVHLGAGAVTSNVKCDKTEVTVASPGGRIRTGRRKFGAAVGDGSEIGCGSVLCPGAVIGRNCTVYPLSLVRGYIPDDCIFKTADDIAAKRQFGQGGAYKEPNRGGDIDI